MNFFLQIDYEFLRWIQANRIVFLDPLFYWISSYTFIISIMILGFIGLFYIKNKVKSFQIKYYSLLLIFIASSTFSLILKYIVKRPRPFVVHPAIIQLYETSTFSFPSGHTAIAFTLAFSLVFFSLKKYYVILIFIWALLVAYSRMVLGAHYVSDIVTSILIGFMFSLLIKPISKEWIVRKT